MRFGDGNGGSVNLCLCLEVKGVLLRFCLDLALLLLIESAYGRLKVWDEPESNGFIKTKRVCECRVIAYEVVDGILHSRDNAVNKVNRPLRYPTAEIVFEPCAKKLKLRLDRDALQLPNGSAGQESREKRVVPRIKPNRLNNKLKAKPNGRANQRTARAADHKANRAASQSGCGSGYHACDFALADNAVIVENGGVKRKCERNADNRTDNRAWNAADQETSPRSQKRAKANNRLFSYIFRR